MINPQWLELPMSRTNFHGPKDVRAIEVRLYYAMINDFDWNVPLLFIPSLLLYVNYDHDCRFVVLHISYEKKKKK